jgi:hypothetical protein
MGLVNAKSPLLHSCNEGHPGRHFGDGQPAGGRHAADGRLAPFRIVLNILNPGPPLSRHRASRPFAPPKVLMLNDSVNVVDDVSGEHDER